MGELRTGEQITGEQITGEVSRRGFLKGTVAAAGTVGVASSSLRASAAPLLERAPGSGAIGAPPVDRPRVDNRLELVPVYPIERAERPPVRGHRGLSKAWATSGWRLHVSVAGVASAVFRLEDLARFAFVEQVTEFRGDRGSAVVHWGGVRLADVVSAVGGPAPFSRLRASTPDGSHSVTFTGEVALHPQTLLATHMGREPLDPDHGAPLRIVVPVRPARDSLKRVGRIVIEA